MFFSVIIPLFNKAPYIKKALDSVLEQSFRDFELIVVDDGSTDDSYDIAKDTLDGFKGRHQLVYQDNAGVSTARNNGVASAHGDYLCFLDADDWWAPNYLERMAWLIKEYPEAGIYGTNYYYVKNGRQKICITNAETGIINFCKVYSEGMAMPLTSITVSLRPRVFEEFGGFKPNLKLGEDFDLWISISLKYKVAFLNEPLAYYNQDSASEWRGTRQMQEPRFHMLWNLQHLEEEEKRNPDYKALIDNLRTYGLLPYYISNHYRDSARQELSKVNWSNQPKKMRLLYKIPVPLLKCRRTLLKTGSMVKQAILKHL